MSIYYALIQDFPAPNNFHNWLNSIGWSPQVNSKILATWILCNFDSETLRNEFFNCINGRVTPKRALQVYKADDKAGLKTLIEGLEGAFGLADTKILWSQLLDNGSQRLNGDLSSQYSDFTIHKNGPIQSLFSINLNTKPLKQESIAFKNNQQESILWKSVYQPSNIINAKLYHENKVTVTYILGPISFSCILDSDMTRLRLMEQEMGKHKGKERTRVVEGEFYACYDSQQRRFVRGQCTEQVGDDLYQMSLLDLGMTQVFNSPNIRPLLEMCKGVPALSLKFVLDKVSVKDSKSSAAKQYLSRYLGQQLGFQFRKLENGAHYVICFEGIKNLHMKMIEEGLLTFVEPCENPKPHREINGSRGIDRLRLS